MTGIHPESEIRQATYDEVNKCIRVCDISDGVNDLATEATLLAFKVQNDINLNDLESDLEAGNVILTNFKDANHIDILAAIVELQSIDISIGNVDNNLTAFKIENNSNLVGIDSVLDAILIKLSDRLQKTQLTNGTLDVEVEDVAGKNSLCVKVGNAVSVFSSFVAKQETSFIDTIVVGAAWTTILDVPASSGKLQEILIKLQDDKFQIRLTVDGAVVYTVGTKTLKDILKLDGIVVPNATVTTFDNKKGFHDIYNDPVFFSTSLKIEVNRVDTATKNIKGYLIKWREFVG